MSKPFPPNQIKPNIKYTQYSNWPVATCNLQYFVVPNMKQKAPITVPEFARDPTSI